MHWLSLQQSCNWFFRNYSMPFKCHMNSVTKPCHVGCRHPRRQSLLKPTPPLQQEEGCTYQPKKWGQFTKKRFFSSETRCSLSPSLYHYLHYHLQPESHDDRLCESLLSNCEAAPAFWLSFDNAAQPPPSNACNDTLDTTIITRILRSSNIRRIEF